MKLSVAGYVVAVTVGLMCSLGHCADKPTTDLTPTRFGKAFNKSTLDTQHYFKPTIEITEANRAEVEKLCAKYLATVEFPRTTNSFILSLWDTDKIEARGSLIYTDDEKSHLWAIYFVSHDVPGKPDSIELKIFDPKAEVEARAKKLIEKLKGQIAELDAEHQKEIDDLRKEQKTLESKNEKLQTRLEPITTKLEKPMAEIKKLQTALEKARKQNNPVAVQNLESKIKKITDKNETDFASFNVMADQLKKNQSEIDRIDRRVAFLVKTWNEAKAKTKTK